METEEIPLSFVWRELTMAGSLHLPAGHGPHPAVVMAQGSGPADRDSDGYFVPIRNTFLERGVAVFSFDKPGCGESTGDWRHYGLQGRVSQLSAAISTVREHAAVDRDMVGLWGHSQGGWLVQILAGQSGKVAFAVASAAPTMSVSAQILYDCEHTLRAEKHDESSVAQALALTQRLHEAALDATGFDTVVRQLLEPAKAEPWFTSFPTIEDHDDWRHVIALLNEDFEPIDALQRVQCPFLGVYGGLDTLLPPWGSAQETGEALEAAGNADSTVVVFPHGNHRLQLASGELVDGYLDLLGDWVDRRRRRVRTQN